MRHGYRFGLRKDRDSIANVKGRQRATKLSPTSTPAHRCRFRRRARKPLARTNSPATYDFDRSLIVQRLRLLVPVRTMMHAPLVGVGLVSGESHSWGTLAARRFAETIASRRGVVALRSSQKSRVRTEMISFHARAPMGPCDPVRAHILNHNGAAGRIKLTPVLQQTDKHFVAIRNSTPAHPECIADTGVSSALWPPRHCG